MLHVHGSLDRHGVLRSTFYLEPSLKEISGASARAEMASKTAREIDATAITFFHSSNLLRLGVGSLHLVRTQNRKRDKNCGQEHLGETQHSSGLSSSVQ